MKAAVALIASRLPIYPKKSGECFGKGLKRGLIRLINPKPG